MKNERFVRVLSNIQDEKIKCVYRSDQRAVRWLEQNDMCSAAEGTLVQIALPFTQLIFQTTKCERGMNLLKYQDLQIAVQTKVSQRFFSIAGFILDGRRRALQSGNFEVEVFLHSNHAYRDLSCIAQIVL